MDASGNGRLFFPTRHQTAYGVETERCSRRITLLSLLRKLEMTGSCRSLNRLNFAQPLYSMDVASRRWDAESMRWRSHFSAIDRKSIYLGLSHDATLLVQLAIDVVDPLMAPFAVEGDATSSGLRLLIYRTTPARLDLAYEMDLGKRSPFTIIHIGFSRNSSLMCSFSFDPDNQYSAPPEQDYEGRVLLDVLLPAQSLHVSLESIVSFGRKKRRIMKGTYLRTMDSGLVYDIGTDIVAISFCTESSPNRATNRTLLSARRAIRDDLAVTTIINGAYAKDIRVHSSAPKSSAALTERWVLEAISETGQSGGSAELYITENSLNAEKLLQTVATSAVKKSLPSDCKFMGVNAADVHVVELTHPTVTVLVFGIVEFQSPGKCKFAMINALVEWDLSQPAKASLLKWTTKETDWRRAISKSREWFPERLPTVLKLEDRLLTNDVVESLKCLHGSHPGGMVLTL